MALQNAGLSTYSSTKLVRAAWRWSQNFKIVNRRFESFCRLLFRQNMRRENYVLNLTPNLAGNYGHAGVIKKRRV